MADVGRVWTDADKLRCAIEGLRAMRKGTDAIHAWYREWLPDSWILRGDFKAQSALTYYAIEDCSKLAERGAGYAEEVHQMAFSRYGGD